MSCKSINITAGQFLPMNWSQALTTTLGPIKVTYTPGGSNPGLSIVNGTATSFQSKGPNAALHYILWGVATSPHLLLLTDLTVGSSSMLTVSLQEFTGTSIVSHLVSTVNSDPQHSLPVVQVSQMSGDAVMVSFGTIAGVGPVAMLRSDNAVMLCPTIGSVKLEVQLVGNADTTKVYIQDGGTVLESAVFPVGTAKITVPATQPLVFSDVAMGGCPQPPPQQTFTIKNNGTDCLVINSVGSVAPYTFVGSSPALPAALSPAATCVVTLEFQPGSISTFNNVALPITTTPPNGDKQITCSGKARKAVTSIEFSSKNIVFPATPLGLSANGTLKITNNGETPLSVSFPASLPGSAFQWNAVNQTLQCSAAPINVPIVFTPTVAGSSTASISVTSSASSSPDTINLSGVTRLPVTSIEFSSKNIVFPATTLGSSANGTLTITNNGETALSVSLPASLPGSAFQWNAVNQILQTSAAPINLPIVFTPTVEGSNTASISVTSNASSSPDTVSLSGSGNARPVTVPDMFQTYAPQAAAQLTALGLVPVFYPPGPSKLYWVASQSPTAGSVVAKGTQIKMDVRKGPLQ